MAALADTDSSFTSHFCFGSSAVKASIVLTEYSHMWSIGGAQDSVSRIWRGIPSGAAEGAILKPCVAP